MQVEGAEEEEEEDTLAGVSAYALRTFLRQCRELTYQAVGQVAARVPALWQATTLRPAFVVSSTVHELRVAADNDDVVLMIVCEPMRQGGGERRPCIPACCCATGTRCRP